jgi:IMP dehydrogenase
MRTFDDVLIKPRFSDIESRDDVDLSTELKCYRLGKTIRLGLPVCNAAMDTVSSPALCRTLYELGGLPVLHRNCTPEQQRQMLDESGIPDDYPVVLSISVNDYEDRVPRFNPGPNIILSIDIAHAHSVKAKRLVEWLVKHYPDHPIMIGSIATKEAVVDTMAWGADIFRVGIGAGSVCTTRIVTGVGVPQLDAVLECAEAAPDSVIADGGIRTSGDAMKALVAGASMVMLGNVLAGTDDTPGIMIEINGGLYKQYRGMASKEVALSLTARDAQSVYEEGADALVAYKGSTRDVVNSFCRGLRSGLSYIGCRTMQGRTNAELIDITPNVTRENGVHDVHARNQ